MEAFVHDSRKRIVRRVSLASIGVSIFCGCLDARGQAVSIYITPTSSPPPISSQGLCTVRGNLFLCADPGSVPTAKVSHGKPVQVDWTIQSPGWSFVDQQGIVITSDKYKKWKVTPTSSTTYTAKGKKDGIVYKYQISVTDGTTPLSPWDPTIMN